MKLWIWIFGVVFSSTSMRLSFLATHPSWNHAKTIMPPKNITFQEIIVAINENFLLIPMVETKCFSYYHCYSAKSHYIYVYANNNTLKVQNTCKTIKKITNIRKSAGWQTKLLANTLRVFLSNLGEKSNSKMRRKRSSSV